MDNYTEEYVKHVNVDHLIDRFCAGEGMIELDRESLSYLYEASHIEAHYASSDQMEGIGRMGEIMARLRLKCFPHIRNFSHITFCIGSSREMPVTMTEIRQIDLFLEDLDSEPEIMWGVHYRPLTTNMLEVDVVMSR
ncbi:MAG: hypothetical protein RSF78_01740 [Bacteroidales bacterium]